MIREISWEKIYPIWTTYLWPARHDVKTMSSMTLSREYNIKIYKEFKPTFWGYYSGDLLIGVNSGHSVYSHEFRSRGLFVVSDYRRQGIATALLKTCIQHAFATGHTVCWSFPNIKSIQTYFNAGFSLEYDIIYDADFGQNQYVAIRV